MTNNSKLKVIYVAAHLGLALGLAIGAQRDWTIAVLVYLMFQVLGVGIGVHRYSAHRTFEVAPPIKFILLVFATLSTVGSSISWAGIHRLHHQTADTEADPHSPEHLSIWQIVSGAYLTRTRIAARNIRDLVGDPMQAFFHKNYFKIILLYVLVLTVIDPRWILFGYLIPVAMVYWVTSFGIVMNHSWGYRNFKTSDRSVNSWLLSFITLGDGWHNNHHFDPANPSHSAKWWEFDLCYQIIRRIKSDR